MKRFMIVALMVLMAGTVYAKAMEVTKKAGADTVTVTLQNDPPVTGENGITILVKDAAGKAVTNAAVTIDYEMPAMPGMPAMRYKALTTLKGQEYTGKVNFSMPGAWNVKVKVKTGNKTDSIKFNTDVH